MLTAVERVQGRPDDVPRVLLAPLDVPGHPGIDGGHVLTYSGDTGESSGLVELAASADVLLCEAGFPDLPDLPPNLHLCGRQAGEHAARAGAGRLILTHLAPDDDPALSLAGAAGTFGGPVFS